MSVFADAGSGNGFVCLLYALKDQVFKNLIGFEVYKEAIVRSIDCENVLKNELSKETKTKQRFRQDVTWMHGDLFSIRSECTDEVCPRPRQRPRQ